MQGKKLTFFISLLAAALCLTVCAFAAEDEVETDWDHYTNVLTISCGSEVEELKRADLFDGYSEEERTQIVGKVQTLCITGSGLTDIASGALSEFNRSNVTCVVFDLPVLSEVGGSAQVGSYAATVYFVGDEDVAARFGKNADTTRRIALDSLSELCRVELEVINGKLLCMVERSDGTLVSAAPYERRGTDVLLAVLPNAGYRVWSQRQNGMSVGSRPTITEDTVFSSYCDHEGRELLVPKTETVNGSWGKASNDTIRWFLFEDGTLEIMGVGTIPMLSFSSYRNKIKSIVIHDGITGVDSSVFSSINAETIEIGNDVKTIGNSAFSDNTKLTELTLGYGMERVEGSAFAGNTALKQVEFRSDVLSFGDYVFSGCTNLRQVDFYGRLPEIGRGFCPNYKPGKFLAVYHNYDWDWSKGLTDKSGTSYPTVPACDTVDDFKTLTWKDGCYRNDQGIIFTLDDYSGTATVGVIPEEGKTAAENNSGYYGRNQRNVVIPDKVEVRTGSGTVTYTVTKIAENAFKGNFYVESVELGRYVADVVTGAFYDCPNFTDFTVHSKNSSFYELDGILYTTDLNSMCVVPCAKEFDSYEIPSNVEYILTGAFEGCTGIRNVEILSGVGTIQDKAFLNATGLETITISGGTKAIGKEVFSGCTALRSVYIYSGVTGIGSSPFLNCTAIEGLTLPFMGTSATSGSALSTLFGGNSSPVLGSVTLHGGVLVYGAFQNNTSLTSIRLASGIKVIPEYCFSGCTSLNTLEMGTPYTSGGGYVRIMKHITGIGDYAFQNCPCLSCFSVDGDNKIYDSDYWGALYTEGYGTLICYPPAAKHQYYCVKSKTTKVMSYAFYKSSLTTVNIPGRKTTISKTGNNVTNGPKFFWVHSNSQALKDLGGSTDPRVRVFEGKYPQKMEVLNLPDKLTFVAGKEPQFSNLFFKVIYPGGTILLDDAEYKLTYPKGLEPGARTAVATYQDMLDEDDNPLSVEFQFCLLEEDADRTILEYKLIDGLADTPLSGFASVYGFDGKTLDVSEASYIDNTKKPDPETPDEDEEDDEEPEADSSVSTNDLRCAVYVPTALLNGDARRLSVFTMNGAIPKTKASFDLWLAEPDELAWGKVYANGVDAPIDRVGEISWHTGEEEHNDDFRLKIYQKQAGGDQLILDSDRQGAELRQAGEYRQYQGFPLNLYEYGSGDYYFEVMALPHGGSSEIVSRNQSSDFRYEASARYYNSNPVTSEVFSYTKPDAQLLSPSEGLDWDRVNTRMPQWLIWQMPEEEISELRGGFTIRIYFCRWMKDENKWKASKARQIGSQTFFFDVGECDAETAAQYVGSTKLETYSDEAVREFIERSIKKGNKNKAGYYAFTVSTESKDISQALPSAESQISKAIYYKGDWK